ncbi:mannosyltransferase putative-domain-containing protein [Gilbertella persicaria]|uniref:mannosyltransferase putative-domain-containing protein n=1 Tax=Gilbertella persicaria TaxID=101096 RepID=UPI00221F633E|nr:mannosyltransferase putative-domain-containing protein [Gilbertella persicaria]KAI8087668.1 mannosyltransferase putative-domain-containing protein [Gilbertella persicaria]
MKPQVNGRLVRLVSIILTIFCLCFVFRYLLELEQKNVLRKEQEQEAARLFLKQEKEQQRRLLLEQALERERERKQRILDSRAIIEPNLTTLENTQPDLFKKYYIAVPLPIEEWKDETMALLKSPLGQQLKAELLTIPENMPQFKSLTTQERVFKSLFQYLDPILAEGKVDVKHDPAYRDVWNFYESLEKILYPWIRPYWKNVFDINKKQSPRQGIVMCVGNGQFKHAATAVQAIREVLKSDMPIEIFYIDQWDLSEEKRAYFNAIPNVSTVEISKRIDNRYTQFGGWSIKPYAMLASSFSEVILMDADVFLFKKPESFFEDEGYKATGTLFFLDRTLFNNFYEGRPWLKSFLPTYSTYVEQSRWWKTTSTHEQESGIAVMNKKKALFGLLSTCKLNDKEERDKVSYRHSHGDKETFWIGYEMIQAPYAFVRSYGAVLGGLGDAGAAGTVCGNQLHLDTNDNRPWWWNGGILRDKNRWEDRYLKFTHFAEGEDWQFETSCIKETDKIRELNDREKAIGEELIQMDKRRKAEQAGGNLSEDDE